MGAAAFPGHIAPLPESETFSGQPRQAGSAFGFQVHRLIPSFQRQYSQRSHLRALGPSRLPRVSWAEQRSFGSPKINKVSEKHCWKFPWEHRGWEANVARRLQMLTRNNASEGETHECNFLFVFI